MKRPWGAYNAKAFVLEIREGTLTAWWADQVRSNGLDQEAARQLLDDYEKGKKYPPITCRFYRNNVQVGDDKPANFECESAPRWWVTFSGLEDSPGTDKDCKFTATLGSDTLTANSLRVAGGASDAGRGECVVSGGNDIPAFDVAKSGILATVADANDIPVAFLFQPNALAKQGACVIYEEETRTGGRTLYRISPATVQQAYFEAFVKPEPAKTGFRYLLTCVLMNARGKILATPYARFI